MKSQPTTTTNTTTIPQWLTDASKASIASAGSLPNSTPYTGTGVAGLTPDQLQAFALARGNVGQGQGLLQPAFGGAANAMGFTAPNVSAAGMQPDINGLLNPYTQQVVDASNSEIERSRLLAQQQNDSMAAKMHAWGGDRAGVVDAENTRNFADIKAKTSAGLLQSGYQDAVNKALAIGQGNQNAAISGAGINLAGANSLAGFANQFQNMGQNDVNGLLTTGGIQQQTDQAGKTFDYNDFLRQIQQQFQKQGAMSSAVSGAPHDTTQTTTGTMYSNPLASIAGIGLGMAGMGMNPIAGASSIFSGVNGLLGGPMGPQAGSYSGTGAWK